jgi:hypothetical protein
MHLPYAIEEVLPFYCKSFATMPQKQYSVNAKAMQRHCKGDTASLQKQCNITAKAMQYCSYYENKSNLIDSNINHLSLNN